MTLLLRRLAALLCVLGIAQGAVVQCAGWEPSAQARRRCCTEGPCSRGHSAGSVENAAVAQAEADACCAQSSQHAAATAAAAHAVGAVPLPVSVHPAATLGILPPAFLVSTSQTPLPPSRVPRHLLIAVLLV